ncbi:MAG: YrhB domain-containing protein [Armatimonas sp.]
MISLKEAVEIAETYKHDMAGSDEGDSVVISSVTYFKRGWILGFNSVRFLDSGDRKYYLFGGSLYINMDSGEVVEVPSAYSAEYYLNNIYGKE